MCGVGWLCLHAQNLEQNFKEHIQTPATVADDAEPNDERPARKRQKIAETIETIDQATWGVKEMMRSGLVTVNGHAVANQLLFVNHQLRNETRALAIRYNHVHIPNEPRHATRFLDSVIGHKRLWVQKIILRVETLGPKNVQDIKMDGQMHTRFKVHMHMPVTRLEYNLFLMTALDAQHRGRRNTSFVGRLILDSFFQQLTLDLHGRFLEIPSHVKVFPWDMQFDEAAIRRYCELDGDEQSLLVRTAPNGIEGLVAIAKEGFENGY